MPIDQKKVSIEWKGAYWSKGYLLNENVSINWKGARKSAYWLKMCQLKNEKT